MNCVSKLTLLAAIAGCIAGCQTSNPDDVSYSAISGNLTPELKGTAERPVDIDSHMAYWGDSNLRMLSDDLGRVFYTDHPSRLSPFPIVYTSGMPR